MYVGHAARAVLAVGVQVGLAVVHVQEVVQLLGDHGAAVLVAHLRGRALLATRRYSCWHGHINDGGLKGAR